MPINSVNHDDTSRLFCDSIFIVKTKKPMKR